MSILKGKHKIKEIDEVRCTIVEKNASKKRVSFLKELLEFNGYEVKYQEEKRKDENDPITYIIGVTDMVLNPVIAVYQRILRTPEGKKITADYWNQKTKKTDPNYWSWSKKF